MTRKVIVYSLMVFYIAFQLRPLTVVISDVLAHTFFRVQHMATIHYENGKYHVHQDLKAIADDENGTNKQNNPASKKISETDVHVTQAFDLQFNTLLSNTTLIRDLTTGVLPAFSRLDVPPPKA